MRTAVCGGSWGERHETDGFSHFRAKGARFCLMLGAHLQASVRSMQPSMRERGSIGRTEPSAWRDAFVPREGELHSPGRRIHSMPYEHNTSALRQVPRSSRRARRVGTHHVNRVLRGSTPWRATTCVAAIVAPR